MTIEFKFLHCADLHVDSPMQDLERYEGAPDAVMRGATRRALENLVRLAGEENVDFVVIAGDLFDGGWRDLNTGLFFARQMLRLKEHGIAVYVVWGNHDAQSQFCRQIPYPDNVHLFATDQPQTLHNQGLDVAFHGQGFATRAVTEDLAARYPAPCSGDFNIGILHTALDGRMGHGNYAPCTVAALQNRGYQYWALGHVHAREVVCAGSPCCIVFPGNTQGRHIREQGSKGCELVTVAPNGTITLEHRALDVARWVQLELDVTGAADTEAIHDRLRNAPADVLHQAENLIVSLLRSTMDICRERNQGATLRRAAAYFSTLTCGAFRGLEIGFDDRGVPVLVGLRTTPGSKQRIHVAGMSTGTTDQLYLALRLAAIERYLESGAEPIPFIADDILIQFDDERSRATLECLVACSQKIQVLLFTHHDYVCGLAQPFIQQGAIRPHELSHGVGAG